MHGRASELLLNGEAIMLESSAFSSLAVVIASVDLLGKDKFADRVVENLCLVHNSLFYCHHLSVSLFLSLSL